jgi:hypothetical protein
MTHTVKVITVRLKTEERLDAGQMNGRKEGLYEGRKEGRTV